jgi:hypothetical protein
MFIIEICVIMEKTRTQCGAACLKRVATPLSAQLIRVAALHQQVDELKCNTFPLSSALLNDRASSSVCSKLSLGGSFRLAQLHRIASVRHIPRPRFSSESNCSTPCA